MKTSVFITLTILTFSCQLSLAQSFPAKFNYQVSIRDANGDPISDRPVSFRISIIENQNTPNIYAYKEEHKDVSTKFGIASFIIGDSPNKTGMIENLLFQSKAYHIRVEIDENNGSNYKDLVTTQLVSVPYAMVASQLSQNGAGKDQVLKWDGNKWIPADDQKGTGTVGGITQINTGQGLEGGPISTSGTISLKNTSVNPGTYGSSNQIPQILINSTGQIISAGNIPISSDSGGTVTKIETGIGLQGGPITSTGTISLQNTGVSSGTYGSSNTIPRISVDAQGRITSVSNISLSSGGTQYWSAINSNDIVNSNSGAIHIGNSGSNNNGELWVHRGNESPTDRILFLGYKIGSNASFGALANIGIFNKAMNIMGAGFRWTGSSHEMFANTKNFVTEHPKYSDSLIVYTCVEGPEAAAYERGTSRMVNGRAEVKFSEHFGLIINSSTMTINLTPISLDSKGLAIISRNKYGFIVGELFGGTGNYEFDWEVKAVRKGFENNKVIRHISEYQISPEPPKD